jgi:hypothetical protein
MFANKIIFRINEEAQGYQQVLFENGALVVQCKTDRFWTNLHEISNANIEQLL